MSITLILVFVWDTLLCYYYSFESVLKNAHRMIQQRMYKNKSGCFKNSANTVCLYVKSWINKTSESSTVVNNMYLLLGDLNSLLAHDVTRSIQYWRIAIRWYISWILSQLLHLKKYTEIRKSQNPSYLALAYLPERQWMNYATNRTLRLQSIHCSMRGKRIIQLQLLIILNIFRIYSSIRK